MAVAVVGGGAWRVDVWGQRSERAKGFGQISVVREDGPGLQTRFKDLGLASHFWV